MSPLRSPDFLSRSLVSRAETRFVWNQHLLSPLLPTPALHPYLLPVIHGFVSLARCVVAGTSITWALLSRRSTQRVGVRMWARGGDSKGHVANYVEMEQVVEVGGSVASFVQTRGSIPLFWQQRPDLRYKPPPSLEVGMEREQGGCLSSHLREQLQLYGGQVLVNLVDQKGAEGRLEARLRQETAGAGLQGVTYVPFDKIITY